MTTPEPTTEQIDAVARVVCPCHNKDGHDPNFREECSWTTTLVRLILTTDAPDAQAALAANLPREVRLATLVADGTLGKEEAGGYSDGTPSQWVESVRYVTDWETTT